jgi:hypothetical protein
MIDDRYELESSNDLMTFEFKSIGPQGIITKVVKYKEINVKGFFNFGFGDKDLPTGYISDLIVTNNSDSKKVLATVARTLYLFTDRYPDAIVIATGSTEARTRLYRMGITNNFEAIEQNFEVLGLTDTGWEPFRKNITYHAFSARRKR